MTTLDEMRRELRQRSKRLQEKSSNPDNNGEYGERLSQADTVLALALDLYSDLWDNFPEHRQELVDKMEKMTETFEKTVRIFRTGLAA